MANCFVWKKSISTIQYHRGKKSIGNNMGLGVYCAILCTASVVLDEGNSHDWWYTASLACSFAFSVIMLRVDWF